MTYVWLENSAPEGADICLLGISKKDFTGREENHQKVWGNKVGAIWRNNYRDVSAILKIQKLRDGIYHKTLKIKEGQMQFIDRSRRKN